MELFSLTRDIVKEMRSLTTTSERIKQLRKMVDKLYKKIRDYCSAECTKVLYLLHALRDHVADIIEFWHQALVGLRVLFVHGIRALE